MVSARTYPRYRYRGRFFGRRVNCEYVPLLTARIVGRMLDDPRRIPYLLVWRNPTDCVVREAVRISPEIDPPVPFPAEWAADLFEVKRPDGSRNFIRWITRPLPRVGRFRLLICPGCNKPRRALYAWEPGGTYTTSTQRSFVWQCRRCAALRYASEGGALVFHGRFALARTLEAVYGARAKRPVPWYPCLYTSREQMKKAGFFKSEMETTA